MASDDSEVEIRRIDNFEAIEAAKDLFDKPLQPEAIKKFSREPGHHLLLAYKNGQPIGMVSGVEMTHPDKGTEMMLYELGVSEEARGHGIGTSLTKAMADLAKDRGCYGMWTLTDTDNAAGQATYSKTGGKQHPPEIQYSWSFKE